MSKTEQGIELKRNADRKYNSTCKRPYDYYDIGGIYQKAANLFKADKQYDAAADCLKLAAKCYERSSNVIDAAQCLNEASRCFGRINRLEGNLIFLVTQISESVTLGKQAISIYEKEGNSIAAHKIYKEIATSCFEQKDYERALEFCIILSESLEGPSTYNPMNQQALCLIMLGYYENAINVYDRMIDCCKPNALLKYYVGPIVFHQAMCALCIDPIWACKFVDKHTEYALTDSKNHHMLTEIYHACLDKDNERFTQVVVNYGCRNECLSALLLRIKQQHISK